MSLFVIISLSAMTVEPGAGRFDALMMLFAGVFAVVWPGIAFWVQTLRRAATLSRSREWLGRLWIGFGVVYLLGALLFAIG